MTVTHHSDTRPSEGGGTSAHSVRVLVVVEGENDVAFLRRISRCLHREDPRFPDLAKWERQGRLMFLPFGGSGLKAWTRRLEPLQIPEFHLYDREIPPETDYRWEAARAVNSRPRCRAVLTGKRALENYLHPQAIAAALGADVIFNDDDSVGELVAQQLYQERSTPDPWDSLPHRTRKRQSSAAKQQLNARAATAMTADLLHQCDPHAEVASWLPTIADLAATG